MRLRLHSRCRKGTALLLAVVVMAALAVILSVTAAQIVTQRKLAGQRQRQLQTEWLARAGMEHAIARVLQQPAGFTEDNRDLLAEGKVHIVVEKEKDVYLIRVEATLGAEKVAVVARDLSRRFRRVDDGATTRLEAVGDKGLPK